MVTQRCNLACWFCSATSCRETVNEPWSMATVFAVIDRVADILPLASVRITGGEPFVRGDILQILHHLRSHFEGRVTIASNGTRLESTEVCRELAQMGCVLDISLDGPNAKICDAVRGEGTFDAAVAAIRRLKAAGVEHIITSCALTNATEPYKQEFKTLCRSLGVSRFSYRVLAPRGRAAENIERLRREGVKKPSPVSTSMAGLKAKLSCGAAKTRVFIRGNGDVFPCQSLQRPGCGLGNILFDNWSLDGPHSSGGREVRKWTVESSETCHDCSVRYFCANGCFAKNVDNTGCVVGRRSDCSEVQQSLGRILWDEQVFGNDKLSIGYSEEVTS
jgi:radical SAM protein with 4Fe4S-binding SPASM domain